MQFFPMHILRVSCKKFCQINHTATLCVRFINFQFLRSDKNKIVAMQLKLSSDRQENFHPLKIFLEKQISLSIHYCWKTSLLLEGIGGGEDFLSLADFFKIRKIIVRQIAKLAFGSRDNCAVNCNTYTKKLILDVQCRDK